VTETTRKLRGARLLAGVLAFCLMVSALLYLFLGNTAVAQHWRLRRAREHQAVMEQAIGSDARYGKVKVGVATTSGGAALLIHGTVASESDLQSLKELLKSSNPPCHLDYRVVIPPK